MVTVVCMKWGTPFPADYVNVLFHGVSKNLSLPFRFVCFTDDPKGLHPQIIAKPIPDIGLPPERWKHGCWPKLTVFKPGVLDEFDQAMYLDLDVLVQGPLDPFFERAKKMGGFHVLREWNPALWNLLPLSMRPDRGCQGSCFVWKPCEMNDFYNHFVSNLEEAYSTGDDQKYLTYFAKNRHYLPIDWCVSFRRYCVKYYPFNLLFRKIHQPRKASVVVFHGSPRPADLIKDGNSRWGTKRKFGFGPVDWVQEYWRSGLQSR